ncbi:hypothetical protein BU16DRAFT_578028 [Lophium mytilinum]|uniref:Wax synthase domain-containing protein n=1 Tax=Lophium mytilinum TaxID=390894 RepID=A0A6A6R5G9_9PEZI|nr:hypothetical protein BU16DRAFT_578028 [Lophium mytilinum]
MFLQDPLLAATLSILTSVFVLGFTSSNSRYRIMGFILMLSYVLIVLVSPTQRDWFTHPIYPNLAGGTTFSVSLQYVDVALLQRWTYETQGPTSSAKGHPPPSEMLTEHRTGSIYDRFIFGLWLVFDKRHCGTPWQAKNVPSFDAKDPLRTPSRREFLAKNSLRCLICILLLDRISIAGQDTSQNKALFDQRFVPLFTRLSEVTKGEIVVRVSSSIATALTTYLLFQAMYTCSAIVMVGSGLNEVASWRPLFGDLSNITSLRGAWNKFWHQGMGTSLTGPARYITTQIFHLPTSSLVGRYFYIMLVFQLSGLIHVVGDVAAGVPMRESGVREWFSVQALGLPIEDLVAAMTGTSKNEDGKLWQKIVGFIWVCAWMVWTMPVWTYPISRMSPGEGVLPFSLIGWFKRGNAR